MRTFRQECGQCCGCTCDCPPCNDNGSTSHRWNLTPMVVVAPVECGDACFDFTRPAVLQPSIFGGCVWDCVEESTCGFATGNTRWRMQFNPNRITASTGDVFTLPEGLLNCRGPNLFTFTQPSTNLLCQFLPGSQVLVEPQQICNKPPEAANIDVVCDTCCFSTVAIAGLTEPDFSGRIHRYYSPTRHELDFTVSDGPDVASCSILTVADVLTGNHILGPKEHYLEPCEEFCFWKKTVSVQGASRYTYQFRLTFRDFTTPDVATARPTCVYLDKVWLWLDLTVGACPPGTGFNWTEHHLWERDAVNWDCLGDNEMTYLGRFQEIPDGVRLLSDLPETVVVRPSP